MPDKSIRDRFSSLSLRARFALGMILLVPLFFIYTLGLTENPPGFYLDEAAASYNAYTLSQNGAGEFGHVLPLYFPIFPLAPPFDFLGYADPVQIYVLALIDLIVGPGVAISRGLSAAAMFLLALLMGHLATRISGQRKVGIIVWIMVLVTPWFFEIGRLAFGASLYPLVTGLVLAATYWAYKKDWTWKSMIAVSAALALSTYTYSIGRLLGPLFALGLFLFLVNARTLKRILITEFLYGVSLVPLLVFHYKYPNALTGRFNMTVGYISPDKSLGQILSEFCGHFLANISPYRLFVVGDLNWRHHIPDAPPLLAITILLAVAGIVLVLWGYRRDHWWRFVLFGIVASLIPASLTKDDFHMLRMSPFPVFIIVLTVPVLALLMRQCQSREDSKAPSRLRTTALAGIVIIAILGLGQAVLFFGQFVRPAGTRDGYFDTNFPKAFLAAIDQSERPIYLPDQFYYHALWQAIIHKVDQSNFVRLAPMQRPPIDSLVLSGEERCGECEIIYKDIPFIVYKTLKNPPKTMQSVGDDAVTLSGPRGIAVDGAGKHYVSDTGKSRVLKLSAEGRILAVVGKAGSENGEMKEPNGLFVDEDGSVFVTDAATNKLMKYDHQGNFVNEWRPEGGFYGPREIAGGPNRTIYIVDQGRTRIVRFDLKSEVFTGSWGDKGTGDGQFNEPTGIAVGGNFVFVMDTGNERIQVFDLEGKFIRQWKVPDWASFSFRYPDAAYDAAKKLLYVTSSGRGEVLVFDIRGSLVDRIKPDDVMRNPSSIVIARSDKDKRLLVLNTAGGYVTTIPLSD